MTRSNCYARGINSSIKCALAVAFLLVVCVMQAQQPRRVIYRTNPVYPPVLRDKQIGGVVRILVVVTPAGGVKQTEDLGGNPALVTATEAAVKQWKYEPAANETREILTLRFDPTNHR
jgi:outer membrane biosynthesis protein TonB